MPRVRRGHRVADLAVALLDGPRLTGPLAARTGADVVATTAADHIDVAAGLGIDDRLVVGLSPVPWPTRAPLHAEASATLPAYTGVVSWHALPALHDALADAVAPAATRGAHVLITAPDPGADAEPEDVTFLREVAEGVTARGQLPRSSVAWRGTSRAPNAATALEALVTAHGQIDVVECPVAPGTGADASLTAAGERLGVRVTTADLGRDTLLDLLAIVVRTVAHHEGAA
jgi:hypothetical protein